MQPRVGVSRRLFDRSGRYEGGPRGSSFVTEILGRYADLVPYSAEMEIGLSTLLEISRLTDQGRLVRPVADPASLMPGELDGYVFGGASAAWTAHVVSLYPSTGSPDATDDRDVFVERLTTAFPSLPVEDADRLDDSTTRETFVERIFARARLRELFHGEWRPRDLVAFHARHKLQLLAHDPARYRQAGRLVAQAGGRPAAEIEADYRRVFEAAMAADATPGRHANALQRALGRIGDLLDDGRRHDVLDTIHAYRRGELPLSVPIALLSGHARDLAGWATEQTYLAPFPAALRPGPPAPATASAMAGTAAPPVGREPAGQR